MGSRHPLLPAYVLSAVALLAAALGSLVVMETATVKVSVPTSKVTASRTINAGPSGRELTTTRIQADVTDTQQGATSSSVVPATYATGNVEFWCSPACPQQQTVTEGTLVNVDNFVKQYRTLAAIKVGPQADAHVTVAVSALTAGVAGNTGGNTINKINGCSLPPCNLKATNPSAIIGGADASSIQVLQQSDLDSVRSLLTARVTQDLDAALSAQAGGLKFIPDGHPTTTTAADHKVGDKVATFTMTMTATLGAVAFSEVQADALLLATVNQKIPKGFRLTSDPIQTSYLVVHSSSNGDVTLTGSATGVALPSVTAAELKSRIKGMRVEAARQQLRLLAHGTMVDISVKPAVPWLPVIQDHITVTIILEPTA